MQYQMIVPQETLLQASLGIARMFKDNEEAIPCPVGGIEVLTYTLARCIIDGGFKTPEEGMEFAVGVLCAQVRFLQGMTGPLS